MLGLDTYSLRTFRWNIFQLLDYATAQKLAAVQASIGNFESTDAAYLARVRDHARRLGILLEPGFGCVSTVSKSWNPRQGTPVKYLQDAIGVTRALDAKAFRVFLGSPADRQAGVPALSLARFERLVKTGHPFMGTMVIPTAANPPKEYLDAVREQERVDLERSFAWARKNL